MILAPDRETLRWIQKTLSRARCSGKWDALFRREQCWTPAMFGALVDEFDRAQLAGATGIAVQIGCALPRLFKRIRDSHFGGAEVQRAYGVWALAIEGSALRCAAAASRAQESFATAFEIAKKGVPDWAMGELQRRYANYLLHGGDRAAREAATLAIAAFADCPDQLAESYNLRGVIQFNLFREPSFAVQDYGTAVSLSDPKRSERSSWTYQAALHNLAHLVVRGVRDAPCTYDSFSKARKWVLQSRAYLGKGMDARKLSSLWLEGLLIHRMGLNRHGERLLERARQGFLKIAGREDEYRLVTMDLAVILIDDGETERAAELLRSLAGHGLDPEAVASARQTLAERLSRAQIQAEFFEAS